MFTLQAKQENTEKLMEFDDLKAKYTELRNRFIKLQRDEYRERADWNILFTNLRHLEAEKEALNFKNKALQEENEALRKELLHQEELTTKNLYNDFNCIIKEKEEKFEKDFPPIE